MKILMILGYYYPYISGLSEYARRISEELVKLGYEVTVLTSQHSKDLKEKDKINGVDVIRCKYIFKFGKGLVMPLFIPKAASISKNYDAVNIHVPLLESGILLLLIKKATVTYHCDLKLGSGLIDRIVESIYYFSANTALKKTGCIITYTEDYARNSKLLKNYMEKCIYALPPIDESHFRYRNPESFKKTHGLKQEKIIGFAGRIVYEKGIEYLLDAIPEIKKKFNSIKIVFAGEYRNVAGGSTIKLLSEKIEKYKQDVIFLGNVPYEKLPEFYSACDVLVLPSIDPLEAFGIVQVEAIHCGTPVVASDLPGVRQPVKLSGMGLISKKMDSKDLARKIVQVLKRKKYYVKRRSEITKLFSIKKILALYDNFMKSGCS